MRNKAKDLAILIALLLLLSAVLTGCLGRGSNPGNMPYEPDTPAPDPHEGSFLSDHGTMSFNGDGESVTIDFDEELAELTGLPAGKNEGSYRFLSGELPPHGSMPIRYDAAHELEITVGDVTAVITMGLAAEDGSTGTVGINTVTPERIPMLFRGETYFDIIFQKE